jgi:hypothetical protein
VIRVTRSVGDGLETGGDRETLTRGVTLPGHGAVWASKGDTLVRITAGTSGSIGIAMLVPGCKIQSYESALGTYADGEPRKVRFTHGVGIYTTFEIRKGE